MINLVATTSPVVMNVPVALVPLAMESLLMAAATESPLTEVQREAAIKAVVAEQLPDATEQVETTETIEENK